MMAERKANASLLIAAALSISAAKYLVDYNAVEAFILVAPLGSHRFCNHHHAPTEFISLSSSSVVANEPYPMITSSYNKHFKSRRIKAYDILALPAAKTDLIYKDTPTATATTTNTKQHRLNRNEKLFQQRLLELRAFYTQHGHGSIPNPYKDNPSLGIWAANLRRQYTLSKQCTELGRPYIGYLTLERYQLLLNEGFDFTSLTERQFQLRIEELQQFKDTYGHCCVPERWDENVALGAWISNIRSLYKRKQLLLEKKLSEADTCQSDAEKAKERRRLSINILRQGRLEQQRVQRRRKPRFTHLDDERIQLLDDIGFVWSSHDQKWYEMLEWAKVYGVINYQMEQKQHHINKNNTLLLLDKYNQFVSDIQNQSTITSYHPQEKIISLFFSDGISFDQTESFDTAATWNSTCLDYCISPNNTLHHPLRIWMINQRSNYNRLNNETSLSAISSTMTTQRQHALESIHFPWSGRFRNRIEEVQYEEEQLAKIERQKEKERRIEQKKREERERLKRLTSRRVDDEHGEPVDVMALWNAGEDDEDNIW